MIQFRVGVTPMGAVRMTQRSKWKNPTAQKYLSYKNQIAWEAKKHVKEPIDKPVKVTIMFYYPIPKSWSKQKRDEANDQGIFPTVKPDIDNCVKGVFDALNGVAWCDDKLVISQSSHKVYAHNPMIYITIQEVSA